MAGSCLGLELFSAGDLYQNFLDCFDVVWLGLLLLLLLQLERRESCFCSSVFCVVCTVLIVLLPLTLGGRFGCSAGVGLGIRLICI